MTQTEKMDLPVGREMKENEDKLLPSPGESLGMGPPHGEGGIDSPVDGLTNKRIGRHEVEGRQPLSVDSNCEKVELLEQPVDEVMTEMVEVVTMTKAEKVDVLFTKEVTQQAIELHPTSEMCIESGFLSAEGVSVDPQGKQHKGVTNAGRAREGLTNEEMLKGLPQAFEGVVGPEDQKDDVLNEAEPLEVVVTKEGIARQQSVCLEMGSKDRDEALTVDMSSKVKGMVVVVDENKLDRKNSVAEEVFVGPCNAAAVQLKHLEIGLEAPSKLSLNVGTSQVALDLDLEKPLLSDRNQPDAVDGIAWVPMQSSEIGAATPVILKPVELEGVNVQGDEEDAVAMSGYEHVPMTGGMADLESVSVSVIASQAIAEDSMRDFTANGSPVDEIGQVSVNANLPNAMNGTEPLPSNRNNEKHLAPSVDVVEEPTQVSELGAEILVGSTPSLISGHSMGAVEPVSSAEPNSKAEPCSKVTVLEEPLTATACVGTTKGATGVNVAGEGNSTLMGRPSSVEPKSREKKRARMQEPATVMAQVPTAAGETPCVSSGPLVVMPVNPMPPDPNDVSCYATLGPSVAPSHFVFHSSAQATGIQLRVDTEKQLQQAQTSAQDAMVTATSALAQSHVAWARIQSQDPSDLGAAREAQIASLAATVAAAASVAKAAVEAAKAIAEASTEAFMQAGLSHEGAVMRGSIGSGFISPQLAFESTRNRDQQPSQVARGSLSAAARGKARKKATTATVDTLDAVAQAAGLAAEAASQAGAVIATGNPLLQAAGMEGFWKTTAEGEANQQGERGVSKKGLSHKGKGVKGTPCVNGTTQKQIDSPPTKPHKKINNAKAKEASVKKDGPKAVYEDQAKDSQMPDFMELGFGSNPRENSEIIGEGSVVEVMSEEEGLRGGWFSGKVLVMTEKEALVVYDELLTDDGASKLKEWFPLSASVGELSGTWRQMRPVHPFSFVEEAGSRKRRRVAMGSQAWKIGDHVDAFIQDGWWEGVVKELNDVDESKITVYFPGEEDTAVVKIWNLRPSLIWTGGTWSPWAHSSGEEDEHTAKQQKVGIRSSTGKKEKHTKKKKLMELSDDAPEVLPPRTTRQMGSGSKKAGEGVSPTSGRDDLRSGGGSNSKLENVGKLPSLQNSPATPKKLVFEASRVITSAKITKTRQQRRAENDVRRRSGRPLQPSSKVLEGI